jgi:hypothetical protein
LSKGDNAEIEKLQRTLHTQTTQNKGISRSLDGFRRVIQLGTGVVLGLLVMVWFVDHPALSSNTKTPVLIALFLVCLAYIAALELARNHTKVVVFLIVTGAAAVGFSGGWAACWLRGHL